jgi:4,5:9,10-diseco-3-hydroxy-5,9,17-trioxoandrosta-1(10),2-diene-4-oate hydrolase
MQEQNKLTPGAAFREGFVEADGFRIRYMETGQGPPLMHLHGAGGLRLTPAHDLLGQKFRVIAFEMPGFGQSAENRRTRDMAELALTMARAAGNLGLDNFNLIGTSFGGKTALWLAVQQPERVSALVLEAPGAIRPEGLKPPSGSDSPEEIARRLYAHPERQPLPRIDPAIQEKHRRLVTRLGGPARDADLETGLRELATPTLVLFGTLDAVIPPEMGHLYKELIPNCHLVFVYDAGHAIGAERPEAFTEVVADFLERHEAFIISRTPTVIHP